MTAWRDLLCVSHTLEQKTLKEAFKLQRGLKLAEKEFFIKMEREVSAENHICVIAVSGMTCTSCVDLIQHAISQLPGVNKVTVSSANNVAINSHFSVNHTPQLCV